MIRKLIVTAAFAVLLPATVSAQNGQTAAQRATEEAAVRTAVENYLNAHATGNGDYIRRLFHPVADLMWVAADTLSVRSGEAYANGFRGQPPADEAQRRRWISSVDVAGTAAVARITLDYPAVTFTDFLSLLKINGEWKVVAKTFSSEPKTP